MITIYFYILFVFVSKNYNGNHYTESILGKHSKINYLSEMEIVNFDTFSIRLLTLEDSNEFFKLIDQNRPRLEAFFTGTIARTRTLEDANAYVIEITQKAKARTYLT